MNWSRWTQEDIVYLTKAYFAGKRLKTIAIELNRTEMGINKALQRFKIRRKRKNFLKTK